MSAESWGRYPRAQQDVEKLHWREEISLQSDQLLLPYGLGRSYGDSCLVPGGKLVVTTALDRFISFDKELGVLRCEAGVSLAQCLELVIPFGWFLSVSPGTKYVTVGGAVANDVHGKNHHSAGTFGNFVTCLQLSRSDGSSVICSEEKESDLFHATIGGLGLTGFINWVEFRLKKGQPYFDVDYQRFANLDEFFEVSESTMDRFEYTVSWVDCAARGKALGRGVFMGGNHAKICQSANFTLQKLRYIHSNPVRSGFVQRTIDWKYSSAANYEGKIGLLDIDLLDAAYFV